MGLVSTIIRAIRSVNGQTGPHVSLGASDVGAAEAAHTHNAADISSGTLANARTTATPNATASTIVSRNPGGGTSLGAGGLNVAGGVTVGGMLALSGSGLSAANGIVVTYLSWPTTAPSFPTPAIVPIVHGGGVGFGPSNGWVRGFSFVGGAGEVAASGQFRSDSGFNTSTTGVGLELKPSMLQRTNSLFFELTQGNPGMFTFSGHNNVHCGILYNARTSTTNNVFLAEEAREWAESTHATRKARVIWRVYDTAAREAVRMEASGSAAMLGFFGASAVVKPAVTGSRGGNAALASLLTQLAALGLITDNTTA